VGTIFPHFSNGFFFPHPDGNTFLKGLLPLTRQEKTLKADCLKWGTNSWLFPSFSFPSFQSFPPMLFRVLPPPVPRAIHSSEFGGTGRIDGIFHHWCMGGPIHNSTSWIFFAPDLLSLRFDVTVLSLDSCTFADIRQSEVTLPTITRYDLARP